MSIVTFKPSETLLSRVNIHTLGFKAKNRNLSNDRRENRVLLHLTISSPASVTQLHRTRDLGLIIPLRLVGVLY